MVYTDRYIKHVLRDDLAKGVTMLYIQYAPLLCYLSTEITGDRQASEDLVQELFIKLWTHKHKLLELSAYKPYLHKSIVRLSLNYIRNQKRQPQQLDIDNFTTRQAISSLPSTEIEQEELRQKLNQIKKRLPIKTRVIYTLSRSFGFSYKEIARHMGLSVKSVEKHISKALKLFRNHSSPTP